MIALPSTKEKSNQMDGDGDGIELHEPLADNLVASNEIILTSCLNTAQCLL